MSEKFGLDWKDYDYQRMLSLMTAMSELEKKRSGKNTGAEGKQRFRPRIR